jgi:thiol-disulfide isomerase/thioredoxin
VLVIGGDTDSNVLVTSVTATDLYFQHARGVGNAKLKNLTPDLQKHFHFNAVKAREVETNQWAATALYRRDLADRKPTAVPATASAEASPLVDDGREDPVAPELYAKSFRGERPPPIIVPEWATPPPDNVNGKFVLVEFWATWCGPCKRSIPHLNELSAKFKDQLVIIGLSNEAVEDVQKLTSPRPEYSVGTDQSRTLQAVEVGPPAPLLMDPSGIVRFEGCRTISTSRIKRLSPLFNSDFKRHQASGCDNPAPLAARCCRCTGDRRPVAAQFIHKVSVISGPT